MRHEILKPNEREFERDSFISTQDLELVTPIRDDTRNC